MIGSGSISERPLDERARPAPADGDLVRVCAPADERPRTPGSPLRAGWRRPAACRAKNPPPASDARAPVPTAFTARRISSMAPEASSLIRVAAETSAQSKSAFSEICRYALRLPGSGGNREGPLTISPGSEDRFPVGVFVGRQTVEIVRRRRSFHRPASIVMTHDVAVRARAAPRRGSLELAITHGASVAKIAWYLFSPSLAKAFDCTTLFQTNCVSPWR